jgi:branched-chain amino acid transport system substrate-binding protein
MARRFVLLGLVAAFALAAYVAPGMGARTNDPGVTSTSIHIGATYPLSGPVGGVYGTITRAVLAYNAYLNAKGGVNGRKVNVTYLDDAYDPSQTIKGTKELVEQDKVFAIVGSLGTAPNAAIQKYLNQRKVPQVLIATGDAYWSLPCAHPAANGTVPNNVPTSCPATKNKTGPYWTFGGLGTYAGEAKLMAGWLNQNVKGAKIGVVYQNDPYGVPYLAALKRYLGKNNKIVATQGYSGAPGASTDITQQIVALHRAGADTLYLMALPSQAISGLVATTKTGWKPRQIVVNAVAAAQPFIQAAAKNGADVNGIITSGIGPNPNDPANANLPGVVLYKQIMNKYFQLQGSQTMAAAIADQNNYAGVGGAWLTAQVLKQSGKPPTRLGLMNALTHLNITNDPFLFKGYKIHTTPTNRFLYPEAKVERWGGGATGFFKPIGPLVAGLTY